MFKKWAVALFCLATVLCFCACARESSTDAGTSTTDTETVKVSVTFNAMKEFVEAIGGDHVTVSTIIPDGTEPHAFEPKAQDLVDLSEARILVYNGLGMESWIDDAIEACGNENLITVCATDGVTPIRNEGAEAKEHGQYDPHTWLSLKCAEAEVGNIKNALVEADPDNADDYESNYTDYIAALENLYQEYAERFAAVEKNSFVTGHAAFGYLCRDFHLSQNSVEDVFAEGEPSAQQLAELVQYCKNHAVTTIFAEELASTEVSETLASEVGAKVETIYTMASSEDGKTYLKRMEENLSKIYASLTE
jgi:zinc transport system substrate-binding protein